MSDLDSLDFRMLKELTSPGGLQWNPRESYSKVAERLRVDEETIRRRVKRAQQIETVKEWRLVLNPHALRCDAAIVDLNVDSSQRKSAAISEITEVDGVVLILNYHGEGFTVVFYFEREGELRRRIQLLATISGDDEPAYWTGGFPVTQCTLRKVDWEIIKTMQCNPRISIVRLAEKLGLSTRTVRRRLSAMTAGKVFFLMAIPNLAKKKGVSCNFNIFCSESAKKKSADKQILTRFGNVPFAQTGWRNHSIFNINFDNLTQAEEAYDQIRKLQGLEVRMGIMRDFILVSDWMDEQIERHLK